MYELLKHDRLSSDGSSADGFVKQWLFLDTSALFSRDTNWITSSTSHPYKFSRLVPSVWFQRSSSVWFQRSFCEQDVQTAFRENAYLSGRHYSNRWNSEDDVWNIQVKSTTVYLTKRLMQPRGNEWRCMIPTWTDDSYRKDWTPGIVYSTSACLFTEALKQYASPSIRKLTMKGEE